jgi:hypothetical protein
MAEDSSEPVSAGRYLFKLLTVGRGREHGRRPGGRRGTIESALDAGTIEYVLRSFGPWAP